MTIKPCALFIDLRQKAAIDAWSGHVFTMAYIVAANLKPTTDFFTQHQHQLSLIPHITCEITQAEILPFILSQDYITRLSLLIDFITPDVIHSNKNIDAIIHWDHRRTFDFHKTKIATAIAQNITHFSIYGLQDFTLWQELQTGLNKQGFHFYERFHAARPSHESLYQNHITHFGDVIAFGGWSRITDNQNITKTRSPHQIDWQTLDSQTQCEERLLLGFSNRQGVSLKFLETKHFQNTISNGLAVIKNDALCPTDEGLWDIVKLASLIT